MVEEEDEEEVVEVVEGVGLEGREVVERALWVVSRVVMEPEEGRRGGEEEEEAAVFEGDEAGAVPGEEGGEGRGGEPLMLMSVLVDVVTVVGATCPLSSPASSTTTMASPSS